MKNWKTVKLGEVASGFDYGMNVPATEYDGENKYIRITDIDEDSHKYLNTDIVSPNGFRDEKYIVNENDILLARTGASTGKAYLYDKNDGKLFFAGFLIRINIKTANPYFVFLQTLTARYKKWVKIMSVRSGQPGINANEYAMFKFPIPPIEIQNKIAEILSTQDKLIELKQKLVDQKKQQKKWLMQNLLTGKIRLKGFEGEWEKIKLGEIGTFKKGKGISLANVVENGLPAIMYGDIYVKYDISFNKVDYRINSQTAKNSTEIYNGDLLFTCSGETAIEIGKCVCYCGHETVYAGGDILIMTPDNVNSLFLAYQQNSFSLIKQKAKLAQGFSIVHIYLDSLKNLECIIPPIKEQTAIAEILSVQDKEIELLEKELEQEKLKKKALMQFLLKEE